MNGTDADPCPTDYALTQLSDGRGVILNLRSGSYFKVNSAGCVIFNEWSKQTNLGLRARRIAAKLGVSEERATELFNSVLTALTHEAPRHPPSDAFVYGQVSDGVYALIEDGRTIFSVHETDRIFRFHVGIGELRGPLEGYVRALLPKLLSILGLRVIHAACCKTAKGTLAFTGKSGAGKTTTARAFERVGANLISEDLIVLRMLETAVDILPHGEPFARGWSSQWATTLKTRCNDPIDFTPLYEVQDLPGIRLDQLWFIGADQRRGQDFELTPLPPMDGLLELLSNGFLGSDHPRLWQTFLETSRAIAETATLFAAIMPEGLPQLQRAAERYMVNSA
jgi:hypothetical protein